MKSHTFPCLDLPRPNPTAAMRLFCFPFAGGGTAAYRHWAALLPNSVEMLSFRPPGRESRWKEPPFVHLPALLDEIEIAICPLLDRPFALFGHSMGALVAYEIGRRLESKGDAKPSHLFVSGRRAPFLPPARPSLGRACDDELLAELVRLRGIGKKPLASQELLRLMLPTVRADFAAIESYRHEDLSALQCPITALGGHEDPDVTMEHLEAWRTLTRATFQVHQLPGNHFFIQSSEQRLLELLSRELRFISDLASPPQRWLRRSEIPAMAEGVVHVWSVELEQSNNHIERLWRTLSDDEKARAARFSFERDRRYFIVGRGFLREAVGRYLNRDPASVRFEYSKNGKPALVEQGTGLRFNLAHSHGLALLAITRNRDVGVDVEYARRDFEIERLIENCFSSQEVRAFNALPCSQRRDGFFRCWTRKEAYLKATSFGLAIPLHSFDVSFDDDARLLATRPDSEEAKRWSLVDLDPAHGYVAALAFEGPSPQLVRGRWFFF